MRRLDAGRIIRGTVRGVNAAQILERFAGIVKAVANPALSVYLVGRAATLVEVTWVAADYRPCDRLNCFREEL